jgi:hypothetical protein
MVIGAMVAATALVLVRKRAALLEHFQGRWNHLPTRKMRQIKRLERRL